MVVPVGGGGLASGIGIALREAGADVEIIGVQASACAPYADALRGAPFGAAQSRASATIADGIAIKRPGELTLPLLRELLDDLQTVGEDEIADSMVFLAEHAKLITEGAGAVAVALLLGGGLPAIAGTTVAVLSGGNVDSGLLAALLRRRETEEGRRVRIFTRVPDQPGGLAELLEQGRGRAGEPGEPRARSRGGAAARPRNGRGAHAGDAGPGSHPRGHSGARAGRLPGEHRVAAHTPPFAAAPAGPRRRCSWAGPDSTGGAPSRPARSYQPAYLLTSGTAEKPCARTDIPTVR